MLDTSQILLVSRVKTLKISNFVFIIILYTHTSKTDIIEFHPEWAWSKIFQVWGHQPIRAALASSADDDDPTFIFDNTYTKKLIKTQIFYFILFYFFV